MRLKIFIILVISSILFNCQRSPEKRKIKLSDQTTVIKTEKQLTTTIYFEPKERRSIAVMFFQNLTGDENLQWLQKGLTEMFIRTLSQSHYLSILSTERLVEILSRLGDADSPKNINVDIAAIVAQQANAEAILVGNISKSGDSLIINVKLKEPNQGLVLKEESVEGSGLENILSMVDELTQRIRSDLQLTLEKAEESKTISELTTNSLDAWRHYTLGVDYMNQILRNEAVEQFEQAVRHDSTFVAAYVRLCTGYFTLGKDKEGYQTYQKLLSLKGKATQQELFKINLLETRFSNDLKKMITILNNWLQQYPDDRDAHLNIAGLYFGLNNYDQAIHHYKKVLTIDPNYKLAYNQLGYIYGYLANYDSALTYLNQYIKIAPDEPNPYDSSGDIYMLMGEYEKAEKCYQNALKANENFKDSRDNLANMYLDKGQYSRALNIFEKSPDRMPEGGLKAGAFANIALTHWRLGDREKAIDNYKKALQYAPHSYSMVNYSHKIYLENRDSTDAQNSLIEHYNNNKKLLDSEHEKLNSLTNLCLLSFWHNINIDETIEIFNKSLGKFNNTAWEMQAKFFLTLIYMKVNRPDEVDKLWGDVTPIDFVSIFKEIHSLSYPNIWKYYAILNSLYYENLQHGFDYYNQLIDLFSEREAKMPEMAFRLLLADLYFHGKDFDNYHNQLKLVGMPEEKTWMVIGAFDNKNGFLKRYPPEKRIKLNKTYKENTIEIKWQHANDGMKDGYINFERIYEQSNWAVAYGLIYIKSPAAKQVQFRVGTDEAVKLWLNDNEILKFNRVRHAVLDNHTITVDLKSGLNKVLIKVCNRLDDWGFYFRVTDENGNGLSDIQFVAGDEKE